MFISVSRRVFRHMRYRVVVAGVALMVLSAALLLPNQAVIMQIFSSDLISLSTKVSFVLSLFGTIGTNFTLLSAGYLIVVSILFGVNVALLIFYIRRRQVAALGKKIHFANLGGFASALLGIGCAACGSVFLTAVFGLVGAGSIITFLPLHGIEFAIVGLISLGFSVYYIAKRINDPIVCPSSL